MEFKFGWLVEPLIEAMRQIHHVHARFAALKIARGGDAARVVRVKMNRNADFLLAAP